MLVRLPFFIPWIFRKRIWNLPNNSKKIYLTFDDGPIPEITEWVLNILAHYKIRATFFCIGDNIRKHPEILAKIHNGNHKIGNHTYNHLNGWKTKDHFYIDNIKKCNVLIEEIIGEKTNLVRPPYGKIKAKQVNKLKRMGYKVFMWTVLSRDYDFKCTKEQCVSNILKHTKTGSIIVFHDSHKAAEKLKFALPKVIETLLSDGYNFDVL